MIDPAELAAKIPEIEKVLDPLLDEAKKSQISAQATNILAKRRILNDQINEVNTLVSSNQAELDIASVWLAEVEARRAETLDFVANARKLRLKGMLAVEWGKLQMRFQHLPEHPWIAPLTEEKQRAEEARSKAKTKSQEASEKIRSSDVYIRFTRDNLRLAEEDFIENAEKILVGDFDIELKYLEILPLRADVLSKLYGQRFYLDPASKPANFDEFVGLAENIWQEARRRYSKLPEEMTGIPFNQLPGTVKSLYRT